MTINWTQDEHGNRDWTHGEWSIRIWALGLIRGTAGLNRISVGSGDVCSRWQAHNEVDVTDEGIRTSTVPVDCDVSSLTIPWVVLEAIFDARKIVTQEMCNPLQA